MGAPCSECVNVGASRSLGAGDTACVAEGGSDGDGGRVEGSAGSTAHGARGVVFGPCGADWLGGACGR